MTMKIEVLIPAEAVQDGSAGNYLNNAMSALGFSRGFARRDETVNVTIQPIRAVAPELAGDQPAEEQTGEPDVAPTAEAPKRERGKPSAGRARRTKEEIAEDEAADRAEAEAALAGQIAQDEATPLISTGEERIDPTTPEDAAQDAADEAAEAAQTAQPTLTHDDVRAALQRYVKAYGMPAAMEDGPKVFGMLFGAGVVKVSDIPTDQEALIKAVAGVDEMLAKNPFKREAVL